MVSAELVIIPLAMRQVANFNSQLKSQNMALTQKTTDKTGKNKLTVYMKDGKKTTESVWCSRSEATDNYQKILDANGESAKLKRVFFGLEQIYPEIKDLNVKELCAYLPEHPQPGTIRNWVNKGKIPFHKVGPAKNDPLYFVKKEIDQFIKDRKNGRI